jgi:hypothetical protein
MTHREDRLLNTECRAYFKDRIEKRNQSRQTFERKPLGPEIARLNHLLEDVGANQLRKNMFLFRRRGRLLDLLLQPLPPLGIRKMHELRANRAAIIAARLGRKLAFGNGNGKWFGGKVLTQRIQRCLQVAPAAEEIEDVFAILFAALGIYCEYRASISLYLGSHNFLSSSATQRKRPLRPSPQC